MKTATFVRNLENQGWHGEARLYHVHKDGVDAGYIVVSAAVVAFDGPETLIFKCNEHGGEIDFLDLPGSYRGGLDHEYALENGDYTVVYKQESSEVRIEYNNHKYQVSLNTDTREVNLRRVGSTRILCNALHDGDCITDEHWFGGIINAWEQPVLLDLMEAILR